MRELPNTRRCTICDAIIYDGDFWGLKGNDTYCEKCVDEYLHDLTTAKKAIYLGAEPMQAKKRWACNCCKSYKRKDEPKYWLYHQIYCQDCINDEWDALDWYDKVEYAGF